MRLSPASCAGYSDVRSFEHFKQIQVGMLSEIKRKTLPTLARVVGEGDPQALHHFVAYAPWHMEELRERRFLYSSPLTFTCCSSSRLSRRLPQ